VEVVEGGGFLISAGCGFGGNKPLVEKETQLLLRFPFFNQVNKAETADTEGSATGMGRPSMSNVPVESTPTASR
jgi:hypothetical protein